MRDFISTVMGGCGLVFLWLCVIALQVAAFMGIIYLIVKLLQYMGVLG